MSASRRSATIQGARCPLSKPIVIKHNLSKYVLYHRNSPGCVSRVLGFGGLLSNRCRVSLPFDLIGQSQVWNKQNNDGIIWLFRKVCRHTHIAIPETEKDRSGPQMSKLPPWFALIRPSAQTQYAEQVFFWPFARRSGPKENGPFDGRGSLNCEPRRRSSCSRKTTIAEKGPTTH